MRDIEDILNEIQTEAFEMTEPKPTAPSLRDLCDEALRLSEAVQGPPEDCESEAQRFTRTALPRLATALKAALGVIETDLPHGSAEIGQECYCAHCEARRAFDRAVGGGE